MKQIFIFIILCLLLNVYSISPVLGACDLVVTDIWADANGLANYQVMNIGDEASGDSWNIVLWIDGEKKETIIPGIQINSNSRFDGIMATILPSQYNTVYEQAMIFPTLYIRYPKFLRVIMVNIIYHADKVFIFSIVFS